MINLFAWSLHSMRQPRDDMGRVVGAKNGMDMVEPRSGFGCVAELDERRAVEVEAAHALALDPSAARYESIFNPQREARRPGHRFDWPVLIEPAACRFGNGLAVLVLFRSAVLVEHRHAGEAGVDACARPTIAARDEDVSSAPVHDREEVVEVDAGRRAFVVGGGRVSDGRGEFGLLAHGAFSDMMRSLKSAPASSGMSRTTVRLARVQRSVQVKAAVIPASS